MGGIFNWCLYGCLVVQFYVYTYNFVDDKRPIKLLVYCIFLLETLQTSLNGADLYYWFASGFGNMNHITSPYASAFDTPIMGAVVSFMVQMFFVYRIWVLGKKRTWLLCVLIVATSFVDATAAIWGGTYTHIKGRFARGRVLKILATTWLVGNTVSDMLIASAMLFFLIRRRVKDGFLSSHALVSVVRLTVESNLLTATISLISMLMVVIYPEKGYYLCPTQVLGKLYSNTLLVSLNNRIALRDTSLSQGGVIRSPEGSFPDTARSEAASGMMLMEGEKSQANTFRIQPLDFETPDPRLGDRIIVTPWAPPDIA